MAILSQINKTNTAQYHGNPVTDKSDRFWALLMTTLSQINRTDSGIAMTTLSQINRTDSGHCYDNPVADKSDRFWALL